MEDDQELDLNEVLNEFKIIIAEQAQQIAILKATITAIKANKVE